MRPDTLHVSLKTVLGASSLLGHELEDRSGICDLQSVELSQAISEQTAVHLRGDSQRELFCVAPLDILVAENDGRKTFHLLELNGTGIGGLTNMPNEAVRAVLESLEEFCTGFTSPDSVVLLAVSGKECEQNPRLNRLMHEKLLFADAMRRGLTRTFGDCDVATLTTMGQVGTDGPLVVVGYIKELMNALNCDEAGTLWLAGRRVAGAVNDRFCRNVLQRFDDRVDLTQFRTLNRCFVPGSDKGSAYGLVNGLVQSQPRESLPDAVHFSHAHDRRSLIVEVLDWLSRGRRPVIKPHGTGLGHGIEFFLDPTERQSSVIERIDRSLQQTEAFYGVSGGALPYTVCEYVDACRVIDPAHQLAGHKFELRVVVFRDHATLRAMPAIAKVARERAADDGQQDRRSLINNITASGDTKKICGTDYMLPLCNERTLALLGLKVNDLFELCEFGTSLVRHTLDQIEDQPGEYGLPVALGGLANENPPLARAA